MALGFMAIAIATVGSARVARSQSRGANPPPPEAGLQTGQGAESEEPKGARPRPSGRGNGRVQGQRKRTRDVNGPRGRPPRRRTDTNEQPNASESRRGSTRNTRGRSSAGEARGSTSASDRTRGSGGLALGVAAFAAYGDGLSRESDADGALVAGDQPAADVSVVLSYAKQRDRMSLSLMGSTGATYYTRSGQFEPSTLNLAGSASLPVGRRTLLQLGQLGSYASSYRFGLSGGAASPSMAGPGGGPSFGLTSPGISGMEGLLTEGFGDTGGVGSGGPGAGGDPLGSGLAPTSDFATFNGPVVSYATMLGVTQALGRRLSATVQYARSWTSFSALSSVRSQQVAIGGRLSYELGEFAAFRAGYTQRNARSDAFPGARYPATHDLDIGVAVRQGFTRGGTTFSFNTGSSVIGGSNTSLGGDPDALTFRVGGQATLVQRIGRMWSAQVGYSRGVDYVELMPAPLLSDSVGASVGGSLGRRVYLGASLGYSTGTVGVGPDAGGFTTESASMSMSVQLTRNAALLANYGYQREELGDGVEVIPGFRRGQQGQVARFGVVFQMPAARE